MPRGPNGEKRPADAIGCAVTIAQVATGEQEDTSYVSKNRRKSGVTGAKARMEPTDVERRSKLATKAAEARWKTQEATMNEHSNACDVVAARYDAKRAQGLVDVKFLFQNKEEATVEEACAELEALNQAVDAGRHVALDFGDLDWKD